MAMRRMSRSQVAFCVLAVSLVENACVLIDRSIQRAASLAR
jgi:hypothetical protein